MKKTILLLLPLLLLGAGCFSAPATNTTPPASNSTVTPDLDPSTKVEANTVSITSTGFSPQVLTVSAGTTVTFVNNDSVGHWPAANPHPTHTSLPGFDALAEVPPGGTYSYTFTEAGTFSYHCHLNPGFVGKIIVE